VKYYIYISDAKLDMLAEQVPLPFRMRIAAELKIDIKIFSLSLGHERSNETRLAKLRLVENHIDADGLAGTVDEPKAYFRGALPMAWGPYGGSYAISPGGRSPVVFFGGWTEKTQVGLGGSTHHLVGGSGGGNADSMSLTPYLLGALVPEVGTEARPRGREGVERSDPGTILAAVSQAINSASREFPRSDLEFLARRLLYGLDAPGYGPGGHTVLLGTPIYVAVADRQEGSPVAEARAQS
jgi:hypothetical protein